ncbi:MAG: hypothetical protein RSG48_05455 [Clostridia bacterium]
MRNMENNNLENAVKLSLQIERLNEAIEETKRASSKDELLEYIHLLLNSEILEVSAHMYLKYALLSIEKGIKRLEYELFRDEILYHLDFIKELISVSTVEKNKKGWKSKDCLPFVKKEKTSA